MNKGKMFNECSNKIQCENMSIVGCIADFECTYGIDGSGKDSTEVALKLLLTCNELIAENVELRHRAEVAERALQYAVSEYRCDECPCLDCNAEIRGSQECIDCICAEYKKEAEKDITEEGKE